MIYIDLYNILDDLEKSNLYTINIDDFNEDRKVLISTLTGTKKKLSNANLVWFSLKFPLITLKVIVLIHWQAMLLVPCY